MKKFLKPKINELYFKPILFANSTNSLSDRPSLNRYSSLVTVVPVMVMNKSGRDFARQTAISIIIFEHGMFYKQSYRVIITLRIGSFAVRIT